MGPTSVALPIRILLAADQLILTLLMKLVIVFIPMAMEPHTSSAIPALDNTLRVVNSKTTQMNMVIVMDFGPFTLRFWGF